jgi:hypothetical protein
MAWGQSLPASTCVTLVPKSKHKDAWKIQFALEVPVVIAVRWRQCVPPAQSYVGVKRDDEN